jgi:two-component system sensor histidine kinase KdpD
MPTPPPSVADPRPQPPPPAVLRGRRGSALAYAGAVLAVAAATGVGDAVYRLVRIGSAAPDLANVVMVYLLAVVLVAVRLGRGPAVVASVLGVATFDFFFVPPFFTFAVRDTQDAFACGVMLVVATVTSALTERVRQQAEVARRREGRTAALLDLSRHLAEAPDAAAVARVTVAQVAAVVDVAAAVLLRAEGRLSVVAATVDPFPLNAVERRAADWAEQHRRPAGAGTATPVLAPETTPSADGLYLPMTAARGVVGVLAVRHRAPDRELTQLLAAFAAQAAAALERATLADEARLAWERVEAEFLRNTLLSSVSHDLRTPLAAIVGAADTLLQTDGSIEPSTRRDLTETVLDESRRMERLIGNLLDVTRLESGGLNLRREWQPVAEGIGAALHRARHRLAGRDVRVDVPADLPMIRVDAVSFEQVLSNLLDNAAEYTPPGGPLEVAATAADGRVVVSVADRGPGVPAGAEEQVFQKFFRAHHGGGGRRGIGLGLAICRGIVEAHGGRITVANRPDGGAVFRIDLPLETAPPTAEEDGSAKPLDGPRPR